VGSVPLPTSSRYLCQGSRGGRNVFGGTPNTATGTVALPHPCSLVDGSTDNVEEPPFAQATPRNDKFTSNHQPAFKIWLGLLPGFRVDTKPLRPKNSVRRHDILFQEQFGTQAAKRIPNGLVNVALVCDPARLCNLSTPYFQQF